MDDQRLSEWKALVESTEDPVDRTFADASMLPGASIPPLLEPPSA